MRAQQGDGDGFVGGPENGRRIRAAATHVDADDTVFVHIEDRGARTPSQRGAVVREHGLAGSKAGRLSRRATRPSKRLSDAGAITQATSLLKKESRHSGYEFPSVS